MEEKNIPLEKFIIESSTQTIQSQKGDILSAKPILYGVAKCMMGENPKESPIWEELNTKTYVTHPGDTLNTILDIVEKKSNFNPQNAEEAIQKFYVENFLSYYMQESINEVVFTYYIMCIIKDFCLTSDKEGNTILTENVFAHNHAVEMARQAFEKKMLHENVIQYIKTLGRLGNKMARSLYTEIMGANENLTPMQKVHKLLFFRPVPDSQKSKKEWLEDLVKSKEDKNRLNWSESTNAIVRALEPWLLTSDQEEDISALVDFILDPLYDENNYTLDAIYALVQTGFHNAYKQKNVVSSLLFLKLSEKFKLNIMEKDTLTNNLAKFASRFPSVRNWQGWASSFLHGKDTKEENLLTRRLSLEKIMEESFLQKNFMKAEGIGNTLAFALIQGQERTLMNIMRMARNTLMNNPELKSKSKKIIYDEHLKKDFEQIKNLRPQIIHVLDQLFVAQGKAVNQKQYEFIKDSMVNIIKEKEGKEMNEALQYVLMYLSQIHGSLNPESSFHMDFGYASMTPPERFFTLINLVNKNSLFAKEDWSKILYGAIAFDNQRFSDPLALLGVHFGLAEEALKDIHEKSQNRRSYIFSTCKENIGDLARVAMSGSRLAQALLMQHVESCIQAYKKGKKSLKDYVSYQLLLEYGFTMLRSTPSEQDKN